MFLRNHGKYISITNTNDAVTNTLKRKYSMLKIPELVWLGIKKFIADKKTYNLLACLILSMGKTLCMVTKSEDYLVYHYYLNCLEACRDGDLDKIQYLLNNDNFTKKFNNLSKFTCMNINMMIETSDDEIDYTTFLGRACECGQLEIVKYLITKEANINLKNVKGYTRYRNNAFIRYNKYYTPFFLACRALEWKTVDYLLSLDSIDVTEYEGNIAPVFYACKNQQWDIALKLISRYKEYANFTDAFGCTPLLFACKDKKWKIVIELISNFNATVYAENEFDDQPFKIVIHEDDFKERDTIINLMKKKLIEEGYESWIEFWLNETEEEIDEFLEKLIY